MWSVFSRGSFKVDSPVCPKSGPKNCFAVAVGSGDKIEAQKNGPRGLFFGIGF